MKQAFIALGTNIEPRENHLNDALQILCKHEKIAMIKKSSIYETVPVGFINQDHFLNMVIQIDTSLTSIDLLNHCQYIEKQLGRKRIVRFGPRTIDLDILMYNQEHQQTNRLIIPHPRMHERAFVLIPLAEIARTLIIPTMKKSVATLLNDLPDDLKKDVIKWTPSELAEE